MDEAEYCDRLGLIYRGELIALGTPLSLKTEKMRDHVVEVVCDSPHEVMYDLEKLPGVKNVALFGRGLHVVTEGEGTAEEITRFLGTKGDGFSRVENIVPSLEDVFVSLIEARDRRS
jgi:ABC-2 type transport system ATP-binding protein